MKVNPSFQQKNLKKSPLFSTVSSLLASNGRIPPALHWPESAYEESSRSSEGTQEEQWVAQPHKSEGQYKE